MPPRKQPVADAAAPAAEPAPASNSTKKKFIEMTGAERKAYREARLKDPSYHEKLKKTLTSAEEKAAKIERSKASAMAAYERAEARLARTNEKAESATRRVERLKGHCSTVDKAKAAPLPA